MREARQLASDRAGATWQLVEVTSDQLELIRLLNDNARRVAVARSAAPAIRATGARSRLPL